MARPGGARYGDTAGPAAGRTGPGVGGPEPGPGSGNVTASFATALLGWKPSGKNKPGWALVPNFADVDSAESMRIAAGVLDHLAVTRGTVSDVPKDPGGPLEQAVCDHLGWALQRKDPERGWRIERGAVITRFDQYAHLSEVDALVRANPQLRVTVGTDYLIRPDVTVSLARVQTASGLPVLHAAVSCKWTIRSDRVQNIRHECLQMIRHRRAGSRTWSRSPRSHCRPGWRPSPGAPGKWTRCTTSPTTRWRPAWPVPRTPSRRTRGMR